MRKLLLICCIIGVFCFGFSQRDIYRFKHFSTADGLSQNTIIAIQQDSLGQIWFGTRDGLNKFDGSEFTIYRHQKDNPLSISNNDILCIEKGHSGYLWIGTYLGLNKYNPKTDSFKTYKTNNTTIGNNIIWSVKELTNKEIWVGTPSGVSVYDKTIDALKSLDSGYQVYSIFESKSGIVYLGTNLGLQQSTKHANGNYTFEIIKGTENLIIQDFEETARGHLLLGTKTKSVIEFYPKTKSVHPYFNKTELVGKNKNVRQLLFDGKGNLWLGTYNGLQIANEEKHIITLHKNINDNESLSDNYIKALFKDKKGAIWIGTYYGGVTLWDESNVNFVNITQKPGNMGLKFKAVSSIVRHKNLLFFGTEGGGISILNTQNSTYKYVGVREYPNLKSNNIKSLYITDDKNLWIGTFNKGMVLYNFVDDVFENEKISNKLVNLINNSCVYNINRDNFGHLLFGVLGKGVIQYNIETKAFNVFNTASIGLSNDIIRDIEVDAQNNIWVSTIEGLNLISSNKEVKHFFYDDKQNSGYSTTTIFKDSKSVIWAGAEAGGLYKFDGNDFVPVNLKTGKESTIVVRSILEGNNGNFWISTNNQGLLYYNPIEEKILKNYTLQDGLVGNQFNNNASLKIGNTDYIFGGPSGAVYFNTNNLVKNDYAPQVIITDFKIKNKSVNVNGERALLSKTITFTDKLELSHNQGNFSISFSIPNFINPNGNKYLYRLKGLEDDWIETSQNTAFYTIQNPGNYSFEVKGINNDGIINETPTVLSVRVKPAPWRSWWAFLLYGIIVFSVLYYLMDILKSRTKLKHQLALEQLEVEQTKAVNKAKLEFFTNISHEFRTPLTLILGPLHQMLENYRGTSSMYKKLKVIEGSANHLLQLINRLMDFRKFESNLMKLETAEGNIVKFLQEIYLSFSEYAKDGNYEYTFDTTSENIQVFYDRYKLERVFYNLISNAFRYTPKGGKIAIKVIQEPDTLCIKVEDSGVGIAEEYRDKIFERFFELSINNKPDTNYNKGTGIGLSIVKNIIDLHKGEITVSSNETGIGSVFTVVLPLGRQHLEDHEIIQDFKFSDDLAQYVNQLDEQNIVFEHEVFEHKHDDEKPTILIVEDNTQLRKFIVDTLFKEYNILEAENGKIAYKLAIAEPVDLIVSDVIMPKMTGTELCSVIKEDIRTSHIPVILLTSRSSLIYKMDGLERGQMII
ncbi:two-component regulator propeller domain-containing protein [Jejuia pallidilutea]|uniref:histidine kinase n=1 Tax=Jejuia pallidilutea TaxID=504487 RepID=A0A090W3L9_9FLAO|nr:two-component regulator propeller domain-containing protein [Jejuia pallidilutea]GAL70828.1 DNA-binding response regulator [Jejuia pallidilutea]